MKGYHWRDGVYFNRLPDGSVTIRVEMSGDRYFDVGTIPAMEWASIVHAMGASGEARLVGGFGVFTGDAGDPLGRGLPPKEGADD